jgi:hypothetical protein
MCWNEQKKLIKEFKKYSKEMTATKKSSQDLLIRTKINTKSGKLTAKYRPPASFQTTKQLFP